MQKTNTYNGLHVERICSFSNEENIGETWDTL